MYGNKMSAIFHLKYQNTVTNLGVNFFNLNPLLLRFCLKINSGLKQLLIICFACVIWLEFLDCIFFESADKIEIIISLISCV